MGKKLSGTLLAIFFCSITYGQKKSYVQEDIVLVPGVTSGAQVYTLGTGQRLTSRTYYDGYNRPIQQVQVGASPLQKDQVRSLVYDSLGRQFKGYLPYASAAVIDTFRTNSLSEQAAFYATSGQKYATDNKPYTQQVFENSPLQRLLQSGSVGEGFQPGQQYSSYAYSTNTSAESVLRWYADGSPAANYLPGTLSVFTATTSQGIQTVSYTDNAGRLVLKKQLLNEGGQVYLETYYVYDELGQLTYIVPPKAVSYMLANSNYQLEQVGLAELVFKYSYDHKGRNIEKKVPGAGSIYLIYDPLDRLVLAQDARMRTTNRWNYIKYDSRQRPVSQGVYTHGSSLGRAAMQAYVNSLNYSSNTFEERGNNAGNGYYTNNSFPTSNIEPLAYAYFDDYDLNGDGSADYAYQNQGLSGEATATAYTDGLPTIIRKRSVGTGLANIWLSSVTFYDAKGRIIQTLGNNQLNSAVTSSQTLVHDFVGRTLRSKSVVQTASTLSVYSQLSYDHAGRLKSIDEQYNTGSSIRVAAYEYNELGQLVDRKLHSTNGGASYLQSVDYRYTIRGQLRSINNSTLSVNDDNDDTNDVFGMEIIYSHTDAGLGNNAYYDGQIAAVKWKVDAPGVVSNKERSYTFAYDKLMRLKGANYAERSGTGAWGNQGAFDEKNISYDENGNILSLQRNAVLSGTVAAVDDLSYSYEGNRLKNVSDGSGGSYGLFGFKNLTGSTAEYSYDENGNLVTDTKKGLSLEYNILNRTSRITITTATNRYIDYTYSTDGTLLRKQVYDGGSLQKTTDYVGGFVYEGGTLAYFVMSEGRVRNSGGTLVNEYIIKDQQGNARVSFEDNGGTALVRQENSYYPFGLGMPGSVVPTAANKALYNAGAEWQNDFADLPDLQQTFYRMYDAALGRFMGVDPRADEAHSVSSYQYAQNNPILFNDPLGDLERVSDPYGNQGIQPVPFHGGYTRIGPGSGNHWTDGMRYSDWSIYGGSEIYRAGLAAGMQDIGGYLYFADAYGGQIQLSESRSGELGYWYEYNRVYRDGDKEYSYNKSTDTYGLGLNSFERVRAWRLYTGSIESGNKVGGHSFADNVGLAGTIGDPIGGGAKAILDHRGAYMPRGQIYRMNKEITVRTPIANINTTSRALNYARVGGKVLALAGVAATGYQVYEDIDSGRYYSAGTRTAVFSAAAGAAFIPVVGWGVAALIGAADYIWGDKLYNYVENVMR